MLKRSVSKTLHYLWVVWTKNHFLLTFLSTKLMIFASISYLKTLILLKFSQCYNLNNCNVWIKRSPILYLKVYFTNKPIVQQWDHLLDPPWLTHFCHTMWKTWLSSCPQGFKPVFYWRYVDDIFVLFKSNEHLKYFQEILNSCHISMSFSMETERQKNFFFLDIEVIHEQGKFSIIIYRKATFSGAYSNFESFFYLLSINLVWYTPWFLDVFVFAPIGKNSMQN